MDMIQLAGLVAAQQEKQAIEHAQALLLQSFQVGYPAQQIYFNPMIARGGPATISAPPIPNNKPPQTSLFVGNISDKCTNEFIQQMLEECGTVSNWKRIKGSNGKYQAFGFCDFEDPEGTLRALRVLHDFQIGEKKLNLKADDKVRAALVEHWQKRRATEGKSPMKLAPGELPADEDALKVDEEVRLKILNMIEKDHPDLLIVAEDGEVSDKEKDVKKKKEDRKRDDRKDRGARRRSRSRTRSRSPRRRRSRSPPRHKKRRRHSSSSDSASRSRSRSTRRSSSRSTDDERDRRERGGDDRRKERDRRSRSRSNESEDSDDARERKLLKKQLKEKEQAYVTRLKKWESRERRMARSYEKEELKEQQRRRDVQKEAKKLRHFLEDYDDEKDDVKYYKSSSLFQRRREYEKEKEQDALDRKREQQEIEDLKKSLMADGKDAADAEEEAKRLHKQQEDDALRKLREDSGSPNPHKPMAGKEGESSESESGSSASGSDAEEEAKEEAATVKIDEDEDEKKTNGTGGASTPSSLPPAESKWKVATIESTDSPTGVVIPASSSSLLNAAANSRPDLSQRLNGVFGMDDEEEDSTRKRLKPFQITQEERVQAMTSDERKKLSKQLIDKIPTNKEELFAFKLEWSYVDAKMIESIVRPWVTQKIQTYIGEEERSLVDFVCEKVTARVLPDKLLQDMSMILDDEAEGFVVKMWRLLIFHTESRKAGIIQEAKSRQ